MNLLRPSSSSSSSLSLSVGIICLHMIIATAAASSSSFSYALPSSSSSSSSSSLSFPWRSNKNSSPGLLAFATIPRQPHTSLSSTNNHYNSMAARIQHVGIRQRSMPATATTTTTAIARPPLFRTSRLFMLPPPEEMASSSLVSTMLQLAQVASHHYQNHNQQYQHHDDVHGIITAIANPSIIPMRMLPIPTMMMFTILTSSMTFFLPPTLDYLVDLMALTLGVSLTFLVGSSVFLKDEDGIGEDNGPLAAGGMNNVDIATAENNNYNNNIDNDNNNNEEEPIIQCDLTEEPDDPLHLLTPRVYATSYCAESQVETNILETAMDAFASTDFEHEPHLSKELEDVVVVVDDDDDGGEENIVAADSGEERDDKMVDEAEMVMGVRLSGGVGDGDGGDGLGNSGDESGSVVGMTLEEAEMWSNGKDQGQDGEEDAKLSLEEASIDSQIDGDIPNGTTVTTTNEAEALVNAVEDFLTTSSDNNDDNDDDTDATEKEEQLLKESQVEWMESEIRAVSMGGQDHHPVNVAAAAANALAEDVEATNDELASGEDQDDVPQVDDELVTEGDEVQGNDLSAIDDVELNEVVREDGVDMEDVAPSSTASILADTAERMILGEDIAFFEQAALSEEVDQEQDEQVIAELEQQQAKPTVQEEMLSEVDQWRNDYIKEIRSYVQQKGIEETKNKMKEKYIDEISAVIYKDDKSDDLATISASSATEKTTDTSSGKLIGKFNADNNNNNAIKHALEKGLIRRMKQRKRLIAAAFVVVVGRRLFLAWFGNAWRLF